MKKLLLILSLVGITGIGYCMMHTSSNQAVAQANNEIQVSSEVALTDCRIWIEVVGDKWYAKAQYPVASSITVIVDGPGIAGMEYTISTGSTEVNTGFSASADLQLAEFWPGSDGTYRYVR